MPEIQHFFRAEKTNNFATTPLAAGATMTWFTVTGQVLLKYIYGWGVVSLGVSAPTTISLGTVAAGAGLIAATDPTLILMSTSWLSAAPSGALLAIPAALREIMISNRNITSTAGGGGNVNSGILTIACWWAPGVGGGYLVPA